MASSVSNGGAAGNWKNKVPALISNAIEGLKPARFRGKQQVARQRGWEVDGHETAVERWSRMMAAERVETGRDALILAGEEGRWLTTGFEDEVEYENYLKCIEAQLEEDDMDGQEEDIEQYRISKSIDASKTLLMDENGVLRCRRNYAPRRWKIEPMRDVRRRQREEAKKREEITMAEVKENAQKATSEQAKKSTSKSQRVRTQEDVFFEDYGDYLQQIDVDYRREQETLKKENEEARKMSLVRRGSLTSGESQESRGSSRNSIDAVDGEAVKYLGVCQQTYGHAMPLMQLSEQDENAATFVPPFPPRPDSSSRTVNANHSSHHSEDSHEFITYDDNGYPLEFFLEL